MTHASVPAEQREKLGISDTFVSDLNSISIANITTHFPHFHFLCKKQILITVVEYRTFVDFNLPTNLPTKKKSIFVLFFVFFVNY